MKSVLISIQPYWVFLIIAQKMGWNIGKVKTVEVRKNKPKDEMWDRIAKIYCSKDKKSFSRIPKEYQPLMEQFLGKVIGEFVCDWIESSPTWRLRGQTGFCAKRTERESALPGMACLTLAEIKEYAGSENRIIHGLHISDLVIYDKTRELGEFYQYCGDNPKCDGCEAHYYSNTECGLEDYCCSIIDGCKPLKRPPQSWCYVESEG